MEAHELAYGMKHAPARAPALWGFRGIYEPRLGHLDIVWDRQDLQPPQGPDTERLQLALNGDAKGRGSAIVLLKKWLSHKENRFDPGSQHERVVVLGGVRFFLSTMASHGYLFGTAQLDAEAPRGL